MVSHFSEISNRLTIAATVGAATSVRQKLRTDPGESRYTERYIRPIAKLYSTLEVRQRRSWSAGEDNLTISSRSSGGKQNGDAGIALSVTEVIESNTFSMTSCCAIRVGRAKRVFDRTPDTRCLLAPDSGKPIDTRIR